MLQAFFFFFFFNGLFTLCVAKDKCTGICGKRGKGSLTDAEHRRLLYVLTTFYTHATTPWSHVGARHIVCVYIWRKYLLSLFTHLLGLLFIMTLSHIFPLSINKKKKGTVQKHSYKQSNQTQHTEPTIGSLKYKQ